MSWIRTITRILPVVGAVVVVLQLIYAVVTGGK